MTLRTATPSDIDKIMEIESKSFISSIQENRQTFLKRLELCPEVFLIFQNDDDSASGYLCAEFMKEIPSKAEQLALGHSPAAQNTKLPYVYISSFALLPEFRGKGNGEKAWKLALSYFEQLAPEADFLLLVNSFWKGAHHIYQKSGFTEIQTFKSFFPDGGDGIFMKKSAAKSR